MMSVMRCWLSREIAQSNCVFLTDREPREVVAAPSLIVLFNARLDGALEQHDLVLPMARGLD